MIENHRGSAPQPPQGLPPLTHAPSALLSGATPQSGVEPETRRAESERGEGVQTPSRFAGKAPVINGDALATDAEMLMAERKLALIKASQELSVKATALLCAEQGISPGAIFLWKKKYQQSGLAGLLRKGRSDKGKSRTISDEIREIIEAKYCSPARPHAKTVWREICFLSKTQNVPEPTYSAVLRTVKKIDKALATGTRRGMKAWSDGFKPSVLREKPELAEIFVGDHHQFDLFILDENNQPVRPWLSAWFDPSVNMLAGWFIGVGNPNTVTLNLAFLDALRPHDNQPGRPCLGVPSCVYIDNGKDFRSRAFKLVIDRLRIERVKALPYRAQSKPVESWFRVLEEQFVRSLPGWCGNSPKERPEHVKPELTLDDLKGAFGAWVYAHYYHQPSEGLEGMTPIEAFEEKARKGFSATIAPSQVLDFLKLRTESRVVTRYGVSLFGRREFYTAPELDNMVGQRVDMLWDPDNMGAVEIYQGDRKICEAVHAVRLKYRATQAEVVGAMKREKRARRDYRQRAEYLHQVDVGISPLEIEAREKIQEQRLERNRMAAAGGGRNSVVGIFPGASPQAGLQSTAGPHHQGEPGHECPPTTGFQARAQARERILNSPEPKEDMTSRMWENLNLLNENVDKKEG